MASRSTGQGTSGRTGLSWARVGAAGMSIWVADVPLPQGQAAIRIPTYGYSAGSSIRRGTSKHAAGTARVGGVGSISTMVDSLKVPRLQLSTSSTVSGRLTSTVSAGTATFLKFPITRQPARGLAGTVWVARAADARAVRAPIGDEPTISTYSVEERMEPNGTPG